MIRQGPEMWPTFFPLCSTLVRPLKEYFVCKRTWGLVKRVTCKLLSNGSRGVVKQEETEKTGLVQQKCRAGEKFTTATVLRSRRGPDLINTMAKPLHFSSDCVDTSFFKQNIPLWAKLNTENENKVNSTKTQSRKIRRFRQKNRRRFSWKPMLCFWS
jgi:hypothetical protein